MNKEIEVIRIAKTSDAADMLKIYGPVIEKTAISFETEVPSPEEFAGRIAETTKILPWLVYESEGTVVGYAYASLHRARKAYQWSVEVSAYVHADWRRKAIARKLYTRLFKILKQQGYANAYAGITLPNDPSGEFHESLGFVQIGRYPKVGYKHGAWHDTGWWHLRLLEPIGEPQDPKPFPSLEISH